MKAKALTLVTPLVLLLSALVNTPASAILGGTPVIGSPNVLSLLSSYSARSSFCSGALLSEQVVLTAAHCVAKPDTSDGSLRIDIDDLWVSALGADIKVDDFGTRAKVLKVWMVSGYANFWYPEKDDIRTQYDDIAVLYLEKPLTSPFAMPVATKSEADAIMAQGQTIIHFGYGLQNDDGADGKPYTVELQARIFPTNDRAHQAKTIGSIEIGTKALCPGDSGGPWYARIDGVLKIVADTVAASGCRGAGSGSNGTKGTLVAPYLSQIQQATEDFRRDETTLRDAWKARVKAAADYAILVDKWITSSKASGYYFQSEGCHAKVEASLQTKINNEWKDLQVADGWQSASGCPLSNPVQPYVVANLSRDTEYRFRIYSPGNWEWFSRVYSATPSGSFQQKPKLSDVAVTPTPTPGPTLAPSPTLTPTPTPAATSTVAKSVTITCVKGKATKKVTAIKPACPNGWKKK